MLWFKYLIGLEQVEILYPGTRVPITCRYPGTTVTILFWESPQLENVHLNENNKQHPSVCLFLAQGMKNVEFS